jgi:putative intracellular protease/amidase
MAKNIVFVLSSQSDLGAPGTVTGSWLEEIAAAYYVLVDAGCNVILASVKGGAAPVDPMSLTEPWLTQAGKRWLADEAAVRGLQTTVPLGKVNLSGVDAVYFVGGSGTVWDFPTDSGVARILAAMERDKKLVGAVCHGVCALLNGADGRPFAAGRTITSFSDQEDIMSGLDKVLPFLIETRFREKGVDVKVGEPFAPHVVTEPNLVTGQNPASSAGVARAMLEQLR